MSFKSFCQNSYLLGLFASIIFLVGCGNNESTLKPPRRAANGDIVYGGLFRMNLSEEIRSIFPHNMVDASALGLMNQVYEGLMRTNPVSGELERQLAETYTVSPDGLKYTFRLRKGVLFHDDKIFEDGKGRELTAQDVAFCIVQLCTPSDRNQQYAFMIDALKGGRTFYESGGKNPESLGISVIDDYTLELELAKPLPIFLTILSHPSCWIFPRELMLYEADVDRWCIGTGPFKANTIKVNEVIIFERHKQYWAVDSLGNSLPYIDAVRCNFVLDQEEQVDLFLEGKLDFIRNIPYTRLASLPETSDKEYDIFNVPGLKVEYYGFQHKRALFSDFRLRKAINLAVNRRFLVDSILMGYGSPAIYGFVPPAMATYPADSIVGLTFNPVEAQALMAEAGYANGEGFPVLQLQLNDGNSTVLNVAEAVQEMLMANLGITVELSVLPRNKHYEQVENGEVDFWRDGWIADYSEPENFLKLFYGKLLSDDPEQSSYLNTVRFKDAKFDSSFEKALIEGDTQKRMLQYMYADRELVEQAAVMPLYYEQWVWLVNKRVKNLRVSNLGILDLSQVYFESEAP